MGYSLDNVMDVANSIEQSTEGNIPDPSFGGNIYQSTDNDVRVDAPSHIFYGNNLNESIETSMDDILDAVIDDVEFLYENLPQLENLPNTEINSIKIEPTQYDDTMFSKEVIEMMQAVGEIENNPKTISNLNFSGDNVMEILLIAYAELPPHRKSYLVKIASNLIKSKNVTSIDEYVELVNKLHNKMDQIKMFGVSHKNVSDDLILRSIEYAKYIANKLDLHDLSLSTIERDDVSSLLNSIHGGDEDILKKIKALISTASNDVIHNKYKSGHTTDVTGIIERLTEMRDPNKKNNKLFNFVLTLRKIFNRKSHKRRLSDI